uniref:Uncharacterized protein n=1 Tax=Caenorhabditis japonica TaxID=281687 RepID=A0A8R1EFR8_CAEJA
NWVALATCLTATAFAVETLFLYWSVKIDTILKWKPQTFQWLFWINLLVGFLAIAGMIVAIVLAATNHQGVSNKGKPTRLKLVVNCHVVSRDAQMDVAKRVFRKALREKDADISGSTGQPGR